MTLAITRIVNSCVLLEINDDTVLTDPYFVCHWFMRLGEPIGLRAAQLPALTAILGGHGAPDHWQMRALQAYPHKATPVYTATRAMAALSRRVGFHRSRMLEWCESRLLSTQLSLEVAPAQSGFGRRSNNYVLSCAQWRVYVGTEACDLDALRRYRERRPAVDVALLPIDGSRVFGRALVMNAAQALEGARILGASRLIPLHYAFKPIPPLLRIPSGLSDLMRLSQGLTDLAVVPLPTGQRYVLEASGYSRSKEIAAD